MITEAGEMKGYLYAQLLLLWLCISRTRTINTAFSFSTPVWHYLNTSNINIVVIFISSVSSNSTVCHFVTLGIAANYRVTMIILSIIFKL